MRVLVTGGAGYIGSHTARYLRQAGHLPVVFDDLSTGHGEFARFGPLVYGDVRDERSVREALRAHRIEAVIHFAAKSLVSEAMSIPERYLETNVGGTISLLAAMRESGVQRLVFSSSAALYGAPAVLPIAESLPPAPVNPYGLSKWMAEQAIAATAPAFGLRWASLRYFNVIGAERDQGLWEWHTPETHVVPNLLSAAREGRPFRLFGTDFPTPDRTAVRDYVDVRDLAAVHLEALARLDQVPSFISNVGRGVGVSVRQLLQAAGRAWNLPIAVEEQPRRPGDPHSLVADNSLFLTWSQTARQGLRPLEDSLQSIVRC